MTDPREVLVATLDDLGEADVPDALLEVAFAKVFDMRACIAGSAGAAGITAPTVARNGGASADGAADALLAIANRVGADRSTVAEVYDDNDGVPMLIIPAGKLATKVAAGASEIALLVAGARQAAEVEEWTSTDVIRGVCDDFKRLDSGNFAKTIRRMEDVFRFKQDQRKLLVSLARPGWEQYGTLVKRLGGES
jgi:hypothetical protein